MFEKTYRKILHASLGKLQHGSLTLKDCVQTSQFGDASADLRAEVIVNDEAFYKQMILGGALGAAEAFARGYWSCNDLTALVRILVRNLPAGDTANGPLSKMKNAAEKIGHFMRRNTIDNAKRNIVKHYDLSNEFFAIFLDRSMTYSSAVFPNSDSTLYEGSIEKIDRACRKLDLKPGDQLVEIGTGWGALAVHAVKNYGCRVTTTTISDEQHAYAKQRFVDEGVAGRITLLKEDYRNLTGKFDKLVSIEMIEAVGHQFYDTFFAKCSELLKPEGEMVIQSITIADHRFDHHKKSVDFIKRYIFPGGCLPSVTALSQSMARVSRMRMVHMEDFAAHYAETLRRWYKTFNAKLTEVKALGFDERFIRIWNYYLCYCEAAFMERHVNVCQIWLANHGSKASPIDREIQASIAELPTTRMSESREDQVAV